MNAERWLPSVPGAQIEAMLNKAPGNELRSGKFDSPDSSSALAANAFGFFIDRPGDLPPLPGCKIAEWTPRQIELERQVNLPWRGRFHPVLDVLITTETAVIGIESKRFEPFRSEGEFSKSFWGDKWGDTMPGYQRVRDEFPLGFVGLDKPQLVKHALALRTDANWERRPSYGLRPVLFYLYAEPETWASSNEIVDPEAKAQHRREIAEFAAAVANDEVAFVSCSYRQLLESWQRSGDPEIAAHANRVIERFAP